MRKGTDIIYFGDTDEKNKSQLCEQLPEFDILQGALEGGIYLDGESQHLVKQMDFQFPDKIEGSEFIISNVDDLLPEVKYMIREMLFLGVMILLIAGITLTFWVYQSILSPLNKLQEATKKIRDGNLEFTLDVDADDEIGHLCQDFEEMRQMNRKNQEADQAEESALSAAPITSQLSNWPVQIKLAPIKAPYFDQAKLLIAADCTAYAYGNFHKDFVKGKVTLIGCPKLDDCDYSEKLTEIIAANDIKSVTLVRMEVPCCGGLEQAAIKALKNSGKFIPWQVVTISIDGKILD